MTTIPLRNKTRKTTLAADYRLCRSVVSKAHGLMFTNEAVVRSKALVFEFSKPKLQGLHMFFVFYPIDLLFLDEKKRVVEMKREFRPFTTYNSLRKAKYVLELQSGTIIKSKTKEGDEIEWR